jgi:serine/threonine-protein kinase
MADSSESQAVTTGDFVPDNSVFALAKTQADDLVGVTLNGAYAVERLLGEGGMGRVYLAQHTRIASKKVAIKVLRDEYAKNEEVLSRFQREAEAAASVSHPNVMSVLDVGRTPAGAPYLVCEYLEGIDLSEHLKSVGKITAASALHLGQKLCHGVMAAHARAVVHRDLKPQNVFLLGDFKAAPPPRPDLKILDFGLSRFVDANDDQLTKTGFIMGTPAYMAPEQARGTRVDQRVDVYGIGAILFTALTGRPPFEADTPQATVLAVLGSAAPRPRSLEPSIPPALELVIERALARDPNERFPDVAALEQSLASLMAPQLEERSSAPALALPRAPVALGVTDAEDVQRARPRLVVLLAVTMFLAICATITAVTGVELALGYAFDKTELRLLLLAVLGLSLTPAVLWIGRIRSRIWQNSPRVLKLLRELRAALVAATVTYGLGALGLRLADDFVLRAVSSPTLPTVGVAWPGWSAVLTLLALLSALGVLARRSLVVSVRPGYRRLLAVAALSLCLVSLASALIWAAFGYRQRSLPASTSVPQSELRR